jgi:ligand-binding sensor domain-containing protein
MTRMRSCLWLGILLFVTAQLPAVESHDWVTRVWQTDDGLPDNTILGIEQNSDGFLIVGTKLGVIRFDGIQFKTYAAEAVAEGTTKGLSAILVDHRDRLWISKFGEDLVCVDKGAISTVTSPVKGRADIGVPMLTEDRDGNVWMSYANEAFRIQNGKMCSVTKLAGLIDGEKKRIITIDNVGSEWLFNWDLVSAVRDDILFPPGQANWERTFLTGNNHNGFLLCRQREIFIVTKESALKKVCELPNEIEKDDYISVFHQDRAGVLWIGTRRSGLLCYENGAFSCVKTSSQTITCAKEDREGNLWVGTSRGGGGLNLIRRKQVELHVPGPNAPIKAIRSLCLTKEGVAWAVTWDQCEILLLSGTEWSTLPLPRNATLRNFHTGCVINDSNGGMIIGTVGNGLWRWNNSEWTEIARENTGLSSDYICALATSASGDIWLATGAVHEQQRAIHCLKNGKQVSFHLPNGSAIVIALVIDSAGDCWAATTAGSLLRIHDGQLKDETNSTLINQPAIRTLLTTSDGSLWIGYGGLGVGRFKAGRFSHCRMAQGLHDDYIFQMLPDKQGKMWFAGNRGIFSVQERNLNNFMDGKEARVQSIPYGKNEGLTQTQASRENNLGAACGSNGRIWFAMESGVAEVYTDHIKDSSVPLSVVIEHVRINQDTLSLYGVENRPLSNDLATSLNFRANETRLQLSPDQRQAEFTFTAPRISTPEAITFQYQLHGLETEWVNAGSRRVATYPYIPPGKYRFQVRARSNDGVWTMAKHL